MSVVVRNSDIAGFCYTAGRDVMESAMRLVLAQITEDMFVLPAPLCVLYKSLEQQSASKGMKTPHHCVAIKVIVDI